MLNKKSTWIVFSVVSILFCIIAYKTFPKAFPILNISLEMSRDEAVAKAVDLSKQYKLGPEDSDQVATFGVDREAQNFIELDQGGADTFIDVLTNKYYEAYSWKVRLYNPGEVNEAWFTFTPTGEVYGFSEILSDDLYIESSSELSAQNTAELIAQNKWNVDFAYYELVEQSQDIKPSDRTDHTFVYKRTDINLGEEGEYRLKLVLSGNKLTVIKRFIKIPETFDRRYEEMRSSNNTIATIASYSMFLLYVIGGIIGGLFLLNRKRWLLWKSAIYWAIIIAVIMVLSTLNYLPLAWLGYDTAVSAENFIMQKILFSVINLLIMIIYLTLSFVAAESLTRKAFPNHIKFWELWKNDNAASTQVIGRTLAGYLLIGFDLLFVILFYTITANYFGWWTPSGPLFSPDMIATPFPWLSAIGMSLHAGFWEECLFRAIPLASAAIIGNKYGNKKIWITIAIIIQALIFAGAHANYPSSPAYSRLVELIIPSIFWGIIYIKFGLLPVIIMHFGYDVVWFSLPLFVSESSDVLFDKFMVLLLVLVPVWVVLKARIKSGTIFLLNENSYNNTYKPSVIKTDENEQISDSRQDVTINKNYKRYLYVFAILGIISILQYSSPNYSNLKLEINRTEAIDLSQKYLIENNISLDESWITLSQFYSGKIDSDDRFIWESEGQKIYATILGTYINNAQWNIRFVRFEGDLNDKTEEYSVLIDHDGTLNQIRHKLPENREGARLNEETARILAINHISKTFDLTSDNIKEISFEPSNLPNRDDWTFIYQDVSTLELSSDGELRIKVNISGDEITSTNRFIHLPEDWEREDKNNETFLNLFRIACFFSIVLLIIYAGGLSIAKWSKGSFNLSNFKVALSLFLTLGIFNIVNEYPSTISGFSTAQPFMNQLLSSLGGDLIFTFLIIFLLSSIIGYSSTTLAKPTHYFSILDILLISVSIIGLMQVVSNIEQLAPIWINMNTLNTYSSIFGQVNSSIYSLFNKSIILLFIVSLSNKLTDFGRTRHYIYVLIIITFITAVTGIELGSGSGITTVSQWLYIAFGTSLIVIVLYKSCLTHDITIIPMIVALIIGIELAIDTATSAYPSIFLGNVISVVIVILVGYCWRVNLLSDQS